MLQRTTLKATILEYYAIRVSIVNLSSHVPARDVIIFMQNIENITKLPNFSMNQDHKYRQFIPHYSGLLEPREGGTASPFLLTFYQNFIKIEVFAQNSFSLPTHFGPCPPLEAKFQQPCYFTPRNSQIQHQHLFHGTQEFEKQRILYPVFYNSSLAVEAA